MVLVPQDSLDFSLYAGLCRNLRSVAKLQKEAQIEEG